MTTRLLALLILLGSIWVAPAQEVEVQEHILDNGMRLLLVPREGDPNISCGWVARVGSVNERPGVTGVAHLFEHMMFKGTHTLGTKDIDRDLELIAKLDDVKAQIREEEAVLVESYRVGQIEDPTAADNRSERHQELLAEFENLLKVQSELLVKDEFTRIYTSQGGSGMNAFTSVLFAMLSSGSHLIVMDECYRRSRQFCRQILPRYDIDVDFVETGNFDQLESAITDRTRLIISESPTNPYLNVIDLEKVTDIAAKHRVKVLIDGTFATPYNQKPLDFGIDLVLHSATKYLGGHNDLLSGAVVGSASLIAAIREFRDVTGGIVDPHGAYLLIRGLKTFALRMEQHNANGLAVARYLDGHPRIRRTYYPGLESHAGYETARRQMSGFGGVVSFEVDGDMETTIRFIDALRIPYIAPSLGGVESLIEQPAIMSFYEMDRSERLQIGIKDELVRFSVGIENAEDLIADLEQALGKI